MMAFIRHYFDQHSVNFWPILLIIFVTEFKLVVTFIIPITPFVAAIYNIIIINYLYKFII